MGVLVNHEQAITNVLFKYARLMDAGDFDGVAEMFARGTYAGTPGPKLARMLRATIILHDGKMGTHHVTSNVEVEVDDDSTHASARAYYTVFQQLPELALQPIITGSYEDRLERDDDGWYFVERRIAMNQVGDVSRHVHLPS